MSQIVFTSVLADRFIDVVTFRRSGGADSRARAKVLSYFDRSLCQQGFDAPVCITYTQVYLRATAELLEMVNQRFHHNFRQNVLKKGEVT